jgi:hypothetical protein
MDENNDVILESSPEQVADSEVVNTPESEPVKTDEKVVPYARFKEVVEENKQLKSQPKETASNEPVDALEFIKLGKKLQDYSDDEIDFATEVAKSKSPEAILKALDNEMVKLAINAKREKEEREKLSLKPTGTQSDSDRPMSFTEKLASASMADKERILTEAGLYKSPRPRTDRVNLGRGK